MAAEELWVAWLGTVPYDDALVLQEDLRARRQGDELPDVLLLLEHPPTYTVGRRTEGVELLHPPEWYAERGAEVRPTDRGGRATYHGPGQLVGYPVMRVPDVVEFVRTMERALVGALADVGVAAEARPRLTGVWAPGHGKIASIGIHVRRRISTHGFALNVDNDLTPFAGIVPCGIEGVTMTSVAAATGRSGLLDEVREHVARRYAEAHGRRLRRVSRDALEAHAPASPARVASVAS